MAGAAVGAAAVAVGVKSVKAAIDAQEANDKLSTAFKNQKIAMAAVSPEVLKLEAGARRLGFTNADTREGLLKLINSGKSYSQSIGEMTVAQDLARVSGQSLSDATTGLIRLQAGNTRAAKQYGIVLAPVTKNVDALKASSMDLATAAGKQALALAKVQDKLATGSAYYGALTQKVKGQGEAFSKTAAGGMAQFHAQLGNLEEKIGTALLPVLQRVLDWTNAHWPQIQAVASAAVGGIGTAVNALLPALRALVNTGESVVSFFREHETVTKVLAVALTALTASVVAYNVTVKAAAVLQAAYTAVMAAGRTALALFTAAEVGATVAQEGLNVAVRANPLGLLIGAAAALATGLYFLRSRTIDLNATVGAATQLAMTYKQALDQLKGSADAIKQSELNVTTTEIALHQARQYLVTVSKTAKAGSDEMKTAQVGVMQAELNVKTALEAEAKAHQDATAAKNTSKQSTLELSARMRELTDRYTEARDKLNVFGASADRTAKLADAYAAAMRQIATDAGGSTTEIGRAALAAVALAEKIRDIPSSKTITISIYETTIVRRVLENFGYRQHGGPVFPGRTYLVGERGPELFTSNTSGRVIPNNKLGAVAAHGGGGVNVNVTVPGTIVGSGGMQELANIIYRELLRKSGRNVTLGIG